MVWLLDTSRTQIFCSGKISIHRSAKIAKQNVSFRGHNSVWKASVTSYIILYGPEGPIEMTMSTTWSWGPCVANAMPWKDSRQSCESIYEESKDFCYLYEACGSFPGFEYPESQWSMQWKKRWVWSVQLIIEWWLCLAWYVANRSRMCMNDVESVDCFFVLKTRVAKHWPQSDCFQVW